MKKLIFLCSFFLSCTIFSISQPLSTEVYGLKSGQVCAGVNIHFTTGGEKDLDMIAAGGFKFIRMDFVWERIEKEKGIYNWEEYDELSASLEKRGIRAIYILDYSNPLYEKIVDSKDPLNGEVQKGTGSPRHPGSVAAFARWAAASAEHFKKYNIIWEIWNEPNITFWRPKPDINQYITLAMATCKAVKSTVPEAIIIGPATSQIPFDFIETFLRSGILGYLDGVSVHPYRNYSLSPESAGADYDKLRKMIECNAPVGKKNIPIISSEWGYASATEGISLERQAEFITRMQLFNIYKGVPVSIWYDWKNDGDSPTNFEHNCGTVTSDLKPKPSYIAASVMNTQLKGFTFIQRIDLKNESDFVLLFRNGSGIYKIAAWTLDQQHSIILDIPVSGAKAVDGMNNVLTPGNDSGRLVPDLNTLPQYITLPAGTEMDLFMDKQ